MRPLWVEIETPGPFPGASGMTLFVLGLQQLTRTRPKKQKIATQLLCNDTTHHLLSTFQCSPDAFPPHLEIHFRFC